MKITDDMLYQAAPKAEKLWLDMLPSDNDLPEHQFSKDFERKMKKLIRVQRRSPGLTRFISASKRIAMIALVVLTVSFSCLMCVEAYREKFLSIIIEVFEDFTQFSFSSSWNADPELGEIEFDYLPEGMSEVHREYDPQIDSQTIYFEDAEGRRFNISQDMVSGGGQTTMILDTEDAEVTNYDFNGYDATLVVKGEYTMLLCVDDFSCTLLSGDLSSEEIIKIANGVNILKK